MNQFSKTMLSAALLAASFGSAMASDAILEPATQKFIDGLTSAGGPPLYTLTPEAARNVLVSVQSSGPVSMPAADVVHRTIAVGPHGHTNIVVVRPQGAKGTLPGVVYFHGGGWILGDFHTHERLVRELAVGTGATFVFVEYDRSPEVHYPVAIEEDYAALKYVAEHAGEFDVDPSRLAIAGESVGGNAVAAVALLAKERKGPALRAQAMFYPVTDASMTTASYSKFAEGPWLTAKAMKWFWDAYLPDVALRKDIHASPINATKEQLRGLPTALVMTDENDVLRDEGEAYAQHLSDAGVRVTSVRYNGTIHDFMLLNPIANTPAPQAAIQQGVDFLKYNLHK
ncbi:alpha/beta hydrolase [Dyella soli]|uniref:Alpha/beta hydrolase n=1 Tax=Dyella soli TaxID=522319 RepID=A0A4R0YKX8_9GAMM|nr:alpha/beta hydrolase [Dyella soli]TCI09128.1 alpha/beta hydrolase [Dyella soli]